MYAPCVSGAVNTQGFVWSFFLSFFFSFFFLFFFFLFFFKMHASHINFHSFNIFIYHRLAVVLGHWKWGFPRKFKHVCIFVLYQRSFQPLQSVCLGRADGVGMLGNFIAETRTHSHKVGYKFRCQHCTNLHYADFSSRCNLTFSPPASKSCCLLITDNSAFK